MANELEAGYDYFPLSVGRSWTYALDSVVYYDLGEQVDTFSGWVRDVVTGTWRTGSDSLYRVTRAFRQKENDPWVPQGMYLLGHNGARAVRQMGNLRLVPLVFPVRPGQSWDPTIFFDDSRAFPVGADRVVVYKNWSGRIMDTTGIFRQDELELSGIAEVVLAGTVNAIELRYARERYARGIGLVSRDWYILDSQCLCCPTEVLDIDCWSEQAERGLIIRQRLIDYQ